jgi:hypothetical protein
MAGMINVSSVLTRVHFGIDLVRPMCAVGITRLVIMLMSNRMSRVNLMLI